MRYCPRCDTEYTDEVGVCPDDGALLLGRDEYERQAQARAPLKAARLTVVDTFPNPFEAEQIAFSLEADGYDVSLVSTKARTVGPLTEPGPDTFALAVPESQAPKALESVRLWRRQLEQSAAEAERAAREEESLSEEPPEPAPS